MARTSELVRQWQILRDIDAARTGIAIAKLASERGMWQRTVRRDPDGHFCRDPLHDDAARALLKIERALPLACRKFIDQLLRALKAKPRGRRKQDERKLRQILGRVVDATLLHRRCEMRYHSASSHRTKDYVVEPQRIVCADGGI